MHYNSIMLVGTNHLLKSKKKSKKKIAYVFFDRYFLNKKIRRTFETSPPDLHRPLNIFQI